MLADLDFRMYFLSLVVRGPTVMRGVGGEMGNFWRDGKNNIFCLQGNIGEYCLPIIFFSRHDYRSHGSDEPLYIQEKKLSP